MKKLFFICFLFLVLIFSSENASAASIGVKPDKIKISGIANNTLSQEILIFNAGQSPGIYSLSPDNGENFIIIEPKEFLLEAGEERLVNVKIKSYFPKIINTNISIISSPLNASGFLTSAGIKIPLEARFYFSKTQIIVLSFCFSVIIMILLRIILNKIAVKKKKI